MIFSRGLELYPMIKFDDKAIGLMIKFDDKAIDDKAIGNIFK